MCLLVVGEICTLDFAYMFGSLKPRKYARKMTKNEQDLHLTWVGVGR